MTHVKHSLHTGRQHLAGNSIFLPGSSDGSRQPVMPPQTFVMARVCSFANYRAIQTIRNEICHAHSGNYDAKNEILHLTEKQQITYAQKNTRLSPWHKYLDAQFGERYE